MRSNEYEPKDSRRVTGEKGQRGKSWREQEGRPRRGEYEPEDSRNVTGTASTPDGRWTNRAGKPPLAGGRASKVKDKEREDR